MVVIKLKKEIAKAIVNYVVTRKGNLVKFEKFSTARKSKYQTKPAAPLPPNGTLFPYFSYISDNVCYKNRNILKMPYKKSTYVIILKRR